MNKVYIIELISLYALSSIDKVFIALFDDEELAEIEEELLLSYGLLAA